QHNSIREVALWQSTHNFAQTWAPEPSSLSTAFLSKAWDPPDLTIMTYSLLATNWIILLKAVPAMMKSKAEPATTPSAAQTATVFSRAATATMISTDRQEPKDCLVESVTTSCARVAHRMIAISLTAARATIHSVFTAQVHLEYPTSP